MIIQISMLDTLTFFNICKSIDKNKKIKIEHKN
jgi:hypothetical protein